MDLTGIPARASHSWHQIPCRARNDWFLGLDVGQSIDPSAVCALNHVVTPHDEWTPNLKAETWTQNKTERFFVRHLERLPLQIPYPQQVQHVANLLQRDPLQGATFALDYTGCGRPVADLFERAGLRPQCVLITAGNEVTQHGGTTWHVPKATLISGLEARLHTGELKIAAQLTESPVLRDELKDFSRKVSDTGRITWNARAGKHDDLILSVAIALFASLNRPVCIVEPLML